MGYRSRIVIALDKKTVFKENLLKNNLPQLLLENEADIEEIDDYAYYWVFSDIKWSVSYPVIEEVMVFLASLDIADYAFLNVGEDGEIITNGTLDNFNINYYIAIETPYGIV